MLGHHRATGNKFCLFALIIGILLSSSLCFVSASSFTEDFEGAFPSGNGWTVWDSNSNGGYDYWDDTPYRNNGGSKSGWCADIGSQDDYTIIFTENFEGAFPSENWLLGDWNSNSGYDYWGDVSCKSYNGYWSGWCSDSGDQSDCMNYDNYMSSYMVRKYSIDASSWDSAAFSFYTWYNTESGYDYMQVIASGDGGSNWYLIGDKFEGSSNGWEYHTLSVPSQYLTSQFKIGFYFYSDSSITYEGAYVDDITLQKIESRSNLNIHQYDDNMDAYMMKQVDLRAYTSVNLSYDYWVDVEDFYDYLKVQTSIDGSTWIDKKTYSEDYDSYDGDPYARAWYSDSVDLTSYAGSTAYIRFLFHSDGSVHDREGAYIDSIVLNGTIDCSCSNCSECEAKLNNPSCTVVNLTTNINISEACIYNPYNFNNKIFDCQGHTIKGNNTYSYGIYLYNKTNNTIKNCLINDFYYGVYLDSSSNNILTNNTAKENSVYDIYIRADSDIHCNNIIENNTGSGDRAIKYFNSSVNLQNEVLSELILCNADNSNINNVTLAGSDSLDNNGLLVSRIENSNFTNVNSLNNYFGIYLSSSSDNTLTGNTLNSNDLLGIVLEYSPNNTLTNNTANNNTIGIYLYSSSNNTLQENEISNNSIGIYSQNSNSSINSNFVCGNNDSDFSSSDWRSSSGDNNTCDKPDNWNDNSMSSGCTYACDACLQPYLITTSKNVTQNQIFNFSAGVKCSCSYCGNVTATLDPEIIFFSDTFPTSSIDYSKWSITSGDPEVNSLGYNEPSAWYSLELDGEGDVITSKNMDLSTSNNMIMSFWYERGGGGEAPDPSDWLSLEYYSKSGWKTLWSINGNSSKENEYHQVILTLPSDAYHKDFKFRFNSTGSGYGFDDFYIDDMFLRSSTYSAKRESHGWESESWTVLNEVSNCDDCGEQLSIPFNFNFYGTDYDKICVSSNGYIKPGNDTSCGSIHPHNYQNVISGIERDLKPSANGTINYYLSQDKVVIFYDSVVCYSGCEENSFQIVIYPDSTIRIHYGNLSAIDGWSGISDGSILDQTEVQELSNGYSYHLYPIGEIRTHTLQKTSNCSTSGCWTEVYFNDFLEDECELISASIDIDISGDLKETYEYVDIYADSIYLGECDGYGDDCIFDNCYVRDVTGSAMDNSLWIDAYASTDVNYDPGCGYYLGLKATLTLKEYCGKGAVPAGAGVPFYTINSNPQTCYNMHQNDTCNITWFVNATGEMGKTWDLFTFYNSSSVKSIRSKEVEITISCDDSDNDGICSDMDNCPITYNPDQNDTDNDFIGGACDNCPNMTNIDQKDTDNDTVGDACDNCPSTYNPEQNDTDGDGAGDACECLQPYTITESKIVTQNHFFEFESGVKCLCNNCGNEAHCGEQIKEDINGIQTIECRKCRCYDCKEFEKFNIENEFNGE